MKTRFQFPALVYCLGIGVLFVAFTKFAAADVHDRWQTQGKVKSELDPGVGSGSNWLSLWYVNNGLDGDSGCLFDSSKSQTFGCPGRRSSSSQVWGGTTQSRPACGGSTSPVGDSWLGCLSYDSSVEFSLNNPSDSYWVVNANNDPAFDQCRAGPPGLSEPISNHAYQPETLYNVKTTDYSNMWFGTRKELNVKVNASAHDFTCDGQLELSLPFISIGSHAGWGNPNYPATLNSGNGDRLRFSMRISDYEAFDCQDADCPQGANVTGAHVGFFAIAEWAGKPNNRQTTVYPRFAWVDLVRTGVVNSLPSSYTAFWSWPIFDSFYWPGGEIAFVQNSVANQCLGVSTPELPLSGAWRHYDIDLTSLFSCLSDQGLFQDDFPSGPVNVTGVHFYAEAANATSGKLEFSVRNTRID